MGAICKPYENGRSSAANSSDLESVNLQLTQSHLKQFKQVYVRSPIFHLHR